MGHSLLASLGGQAWIGPVVTLAQVVLIDLMLASDNAVAIGLATAGLDPAKRGRVIALGLCAAVAMRIVFALGVTRLFHLVGLLLAGGILLLWVCWRMWRDLRAQNQARRLSLAPVAKTAAQAFLQIFLADLTMSLDNVLAVAGVALSHPFILVFGLLLSVALTGLAANAIAKLLHRARWIGYVGIIIVLYVAGHMMWEGYRTAVVQLNVVGPYNAFMPGELLDIPPGEAARRKAPK